jgi:hypothetical protein
MRASELNRGATIAEGIADVPEENNLSQPGGKQNEQVNTAVRLLTDQVHRQ